MIDKISSWIVPFNPVYEGDDTGSGGSGDSGDTTSGGQGNDTVSGGSGDADKKFTQSDVNRLLADDRKKHQKQREQTIQQLETLKKSQNITAKERDELSTQIEDLRNQALTKEELAKKERDKILNDHKMEVEKSQKELSNWKDRYHSETIIRAITDSAVDNEAINPRLVVAFLRPNTRLVEDLDDEGKPAGTFTAKVKFSDTDKEGKEITLDLTVPEAVKRMREIPDQFGSLFKTSSSGGIGGKSSDANGSKKLSIADITKNPAAYREWRKKNPDLDISNLRR